MARIEVEGNELVIRVDLGAALVPSSSGKMMMLDSTHGFTNLSTPQGTIAISLNVGTRDQNYGATARPAGKPPVQGRQAPAQLMRAGAVVPNTKA